MTTTNPYTSRIKQRGATKFQRDQLKQRERGWNDYHAGKDIMAYYDAPLRLAPEVGRANYNVGWRLAKEKAIKGAA